MKNKILIGVAVVIVILVLGAYFKFFGGSRTAWEFNMPVMPVADFNRLSVAGLGENSILWNDINNDGTFLLADGSVDSTEFAGEKVKEFLTKKAGKAYFSINFEPVYKSLAETLRRERVEAELKLTVKETIQTDLIARLKEYKDVTNEEIAVYRDGVKKLMETAPIMQALYQKQIGAGPDDRILAETDSDRELFDRYGHPWCLTDSSIFCSVVPALPRRTSGVVPDGVTCEMVNTIGGPFEAIVKTEDGNLKATAYAEAWQVELSKAALVLREAVTIFEGIPREISLVKYLKDLANAFESKESYPYINSDISWNEALGSGSLLFARIGADEVGGDNVGDVCESKARFHFNLGLINRSAGETVEKLRPAIDRFEKQFADLIADPANYTATPIQVQLPIFIDVIYANSDDVGGPGGTPIGQTLPNWCGADGKGECLHGTMIYVNKTTKAYNEALMTKYIVPLFANEVKENFNAKRGLDTIVYHELFHNLGPTYKKKKPGSEETYGDRLVASSGVSWKLPLEEMKAETGSLYMASEFYKDALAKKAEGSLAEEEFLEIAKNYRQHVTYEMAWSIRMILRASKSGPEFTTRSPYSKLAAVQFGFLTEQGALKFNEESKEWSIDYDKMPDAVSILMKKVGQLYSASNVDDVEKFFLYYMKGDGEKLLHRDRILETAGEMPSVLFDYQLKGL